MALAEKAAEEKAAKEAKDKDAKEKSPRRTLNQIWFVLRLTFFIFGSSSTPSSTSWPAGSRPIALRDRPVGRGLHRVQLPALYSAAATKGVRRWVLEFLQTIGQDAATGDKTKNAAFIAAIVGETLGGGEKRASSTFSSKHKANFKGLEITEFKKDWGNSDLANKMIGLKWVKLDRSPLKVQRSRTIRWRKS